MIREKFEEKRREIASSLKNPDAFLTAVDFFEHWGSDRMNAPSIGVETMVEYAHLLGQTRAALHHVLYVEPLLPFDEQVNGDEDGRIPDLLLRYQNINYQNLEAALIEYRDQLLRVIEEERSDPSYLQTWVDHELGPTRGYSAQIIETNMLREQLRRAALGILLTKETSRAPFSPQMTSTMLMMKAADPMGNGHLIQYGLRSDDRYTIHGAFYDRLPRHLALELFAMTQLGIRIVVPEEELVLSSKDAEDGVHLRHANALTDAIIESRLLEKSGIHYGVVWDQYNHRSNQPEHSLSSQLTTPSTIILPRREE